MPISFRCNGNAALDPHDLKRRWLGAQLISGQLPMAEHIARRFAGRGEPLDDLIQFRHRGTDQCRGPLRSGPGHVLLLPTPAFPPDQLRFGCQPSRTPPRHTAGNTANQHHRGTLMRDQGPAVDRLASRQHRDQQVDLPRWQPVVKPCPAPAARGCAATQRSNQP